MYEEILQLFFTDKIQLAEKLLKDSAKPKRTVKEAPAISYEASKVYRGFKEEQVRRAARSKRKPKEGELNGTELRS